MRARLALAYALSDHSLELREVILKDKPQALLDISSKATVPVLVLADGKVVDESLDIMIWALSENDPQDWLLAQNQTEINRLIAQNDGDFKWALDRYKYADRHEHSEEYYRKKAEVFLQTLEQQLQSSDFLMGDSISLADAAIFPFIRQFAHVDKEWFFRSEYKGVIGWLNVWLESDLFKSIMKKYKQWTPQEQGILFPHSAS
jgi:glutathione S-transferase